MGNGVGQARLTNSISHYYECDMFCRKRETVRMPL